VRVAPLGGRARGDARAAPAVRERGVPRQRRGAAAQPARIGRRARAAVGVRAGARAEGREERGRVEPVQEGALVGEVQLGLDLLARKGLLQDPAEVAAAAGTAVRERAGRDPAVREDAAARRPRPRARRPHPGGGRPRRARPRAARPLEQGRASHASRAD